MKTLLAISLCTIALAPTARSQLFSDNFNGRTTLPPWAAQSGSWAVAGGVMKGGPNATMTYAFAYITNKVSFTNFSAQAQFTFPAGAYGGGLGGRLNTNTGSHYAAWVYPENSWGGSNVLRLLRFSNYNTFDLVQEANLPAVGTVSHTVKLEFSGSLINVYFDTTKLISATDATYPNGSISLDMWTYTNSYQMTVDNVSVTAQPLVANNDNYTAVLGMPLTIGAPGVLANDAGGNGPLSAVLATNAAHGTLALGSNGAFTYNATNNFTGTDTFAYRATDGQSNSTPAIVTITVNPDHPPVASADAYAVLQNTTLTVAAPGVLGNDTDADGNTLKASLVSGVANGTLNLSTNGGFTYTPTAGFAGTDSFTYRANDGLSNSAPATVTLSVLAIVPLYSDSFGRTNLSPWVAQSGNWGVTNNVLRGGTNASTSYGVAYLTNRWTNYSMQASIQFPAGAFGGGVDACLNRATGARYAAWIYPEGSDGGSNTLKLIKFQDWATFGYLGGGAMQSVNLAAVGTNAHTLKLACAGSRIAVFLDGALMISMTDMETPYSSGAIGADFWTGATGYQMSVDDVMVASLVNGDSYSTSQDTLLTVSAPGVLANDTEIAGTSLTAVQTTGPAHGILSLNGDGGFTYTPTNGYTGSDSFTYQANDGGASLGTATVNITMGSQGLSENFDGVTAPALPSGWTTSATGAESPWFTTNSPRDTVPNSVFCPDAATANVSELVSPTFAVQAGPPQLVFRSYCNLEPGLTANVGYDGGVLEIKIGSGPFTDILAAGGSFAANGYNRTLSTLYGNPLGGREAWSGRSTVFSNVIVNLPAAAVGQAVQLRWRCATDLDNENGGGSGWRIDTVAVKVNSAPVLPVQTDRTMLELTTLTVTNTATDSDVPADTLTYSLLAKPTAATISASGVITWAPTEAQGPSTNTFTTRVVDNGTPPLSATNTFLVVVNESNSPPVLSPQVNRTIAPNVTLLVTNNATDLDIPANTLTYALVTPPGFATINTNTGVITLSPTPADLGSTYTITTAVTDSNPLAVNSQHLSATNSFAVLVSGGPVLNLSSTTLVLEGCLPTNSIIDSGETVTFLFALQNTGSANTTNLVATLLPTNGVAAPSGPQTYGVVVAGGAAVSLPFSLTATGACGSTVIPTLQLQDGTADLGTLSASFTLGQVKNVVLSTQNFDSVTAPALPSGWTTSVSGAGANWRTTNSPVDTTPNAAFAAEPASIGTSDLLSPSLNLSNAVGPIQLSFRNNYDLEFDANGYYDGGVLEIKIGNNAFADITNAGGVFVSGGYNARISTNPEYQSPIAGRWAWSGTSPGYVTTIVSLPAAVAGQTIQLRWRCATDTGGPSQAGWRIDSIGLTGNGYVCCSNTTPVLPDQPNRTIAELTTLTVTNTATDTGAPPETLTYSLVSPPTNAVISTNGIITWTPAEAQGPGTYTFTSVVSDNANPSSSDTNTFTVTVTEVNSAPTLTVPANQTINELTPWTANATATDTDAPPNTLTFELVSGPTNLTVNAAGLISWTPTEAQGPGPYTVTVRVFDNGSPSLSITNSFSLTVNEVNSAPILTLPANQTIDELALWTANATATDTDAPPNTLTFELVSGPTDLTVNAAGLISWTPEHAQSPSTNAVFVRVFDNGTPSLSDTNSFIVTVKATQGVTAPTIQSIGISNGVVTITWSAVSNRTYGVDYCDGSLTGTQWSNSVQEVPATGPTASATNAVGTAAQRFYRVYLIQ